MQPLVRSCIEKDCLFNTQGTIGLHVNNDLLYLTLLLLISRLSRLLKRQFHYMRDKSIRIILIVCLVRLFLKCTLIDFIVHN